MVQFAESEHDRSMREYEQRLGEAKASDSSKRASRHQSIEDSLVEDGLAVVEEYVKNLNKRWDRARCLAEYDGINMGYGIAERAKARILTGEQPSGLDPARS
jgi:hypothetical protein